MLFKNSRGLEILNQCAGAHSEKFEIKTSTRIQYRLIFPAFGEDEDKDKTCPTWVLLDVTFTKKEDKKDVITLSLQINNEAILVEKIYISDPDSIEKMSKRVNSLVTALANGQK